MGSHLPKKTRGLSNPLLIDKVVLFCAQYVHVHMPNSTNATAAAATREPLCPPGLWVSAQARQLVLSQVDQV